MKQGTFTVVSNGKIAENTYEMVLSGDISAIEKPGQFINIALPGFYLRRPISVCDAEKDTVTVVYKVVGRGTEAMAAMCEGARLDVLTGLGNGYDTSLSGASPLLIGGGAGVPPMYLLAKRLVAEGKKVSVILGFNAESEVFYREKFEALGCRVTVTTVDGSVGVRGFVTDAMDMDYTCTYACGPVPMLRAVYDKSVTGGEYSFEERMGCGFGACMGCTVETNFGYKRVCRDGPVFRKEEIKW